MAERIGNEFYLRARDLTDKIAFLGFALIGVVWIIVAEGAGAWQVLVTGVLVAAIVAYVVVALGIGRLKLRPDQVGDNCYYLGFTYTLSSLGYALYRFTSDESGVQLILTNLGIALFTTGTGILLRVVLHQMRVDPADIEQESRIALAEAALRLRGELDEMCLSMNAFRAATQQSIAEAFDEIGSKAVNVIASATTSFETVTKVAIDRIDSSFNTFSADADKLTKGSRKVVTSIDNLIDRIERIEVPTDLILSKVVPAIGKMDDLVRSIQVQNQAAEERAKNSDILVQQVSGIVTQISGAATSVREAAEGLKVVSKDVTAVGTEMARLRSGITEAADALGGLTSVGDLARASTTGAKQTIDELVVALDHLKGIGDLIRASMNGSKQAIDESIADLRAATGAATRQREAIIVEADRSRVAQSAFTTSVERLAGIVDRMPAGIAAGPRQNGADAPQPAQTGDREGGWRLFPWVNR